MKKVFIKGNQINFSLLPEIAEKKGWIFLQTNYGVNFVPAFELLDWQLKSLLRVTLFEAVEDKSVFAPKSKSEKLKNNI